MSTGFSAYSSVAALFSQMFWVISAGLLLVAGTSYSKEIESELVVEQSEEMLHITGTVTNEGGESAELTYHLDIERKGEAGSSNSSQSGALSVGSGQTEDVSSVRINFGDGDICYITLTVRDDQNEKVSSSKLTLKF